MLNRFFKNKGEHLKTLLHFNYLPITELILSKAF